LVEVCGAEFRDGGIDTIGKDALDHPADLARDIGLVPLKILPGQFLGRWRESFIDPPQGTADHFEDPEDDIELRLRHGSGVGHERHLKGKGIGKKRAGLAAGRENGEGFQVPAIERADETLARDFKKTGATALLPREFPR